MKTSNTVESGSGLLLDIMHPSVTQIALTDVVHALAMTPRFLGAVNTRYSIGQHLLLMWDLIRARVLCPEQMFLKYFVSRSHIASIGDVPPALQHVLQIRPTLMRVVSKLHECLEKHIQGAYGVPISVFAILSKDADEYLQMLRQIVRAYEAFHLLQSGGWSMRVEPKQLVDFSKLLWESSQFRFDFGQPPALMEEREVQARLITRVTACCTALAPHEERARA